MCCSGTDISHGLTCGPSGSWSPCKVLGTILGVLHELVVWVTPWFSFGLDDFSFYCAGISVVSMCHSSICMHQSFFINSKASRWLKFRFYNLRSEKRILVRKGISMVNPLEVSCHLRGYLGRHAQSMQAQYLIPLSIHNHLSIYFPGWKSFY